MKSLSESLKSLFGKSSSSPKKLSGTILAIDDQPEMLDMIRSVLEAEGLTIVTAVSAVRGLEILRSTPLKVDIILLDYSMPRFSGAEALPPLRQAAPKAKIIALTGVANNLLPDEYKNGVDHLLEKPLTAVDLINCIRTTLTPPTES